MVKIKSSLDSIKLGDKIAILPESSTYQLCMHVCDDKRYEVARV